MTVTSADRGKGDCLRYNGPTMTFKDQDGNVLTVDKTGDDVLVFRLQGEFWVALHDLDEFCDELREGFGL